MSEFLVAIVGGIFALIGTFWGLNIKSLKRKKKNVKIIKMIF